MNEAYQTGFFLGIIIGLLLLVTFCLLRKTQKTCHYDERQTLKRGKGFQYGFFTLLFYDLFFNAAYIDGMEWCDNLTGNFIGIALALCVFGIYCIWNDAYLSLNEKPAFFYFIFGSICIMNLSIGFFHFIHGKLFQNGQISIPFTNLLIGIVTFLLLVTFSIKNHINHSQAE